VRAVNDAMEELQRQLAQARKELVEAQFEIQRQKARFDMAVEDRQALEEKVRQLQARITDLEARLNEGRRAVDRGEVGDPHSGPERRQPRPDG
jgi:predicted  nucleic acid-binding Zn-ribbon protein